MTAADKHVVRGPLHDCLGRESADAVAGAGDGGRSCLLKHSHPSGSLGPTEYALRQQATGSKVC
jgi:hypothetical protein